MCDGIVIDAHIIPNIRCDLANGSGALYDVLNWILENCGIAMTEYIEEHWRSKCRDADIFWEWYASPSTQKMVHCYKQPKPLDNRDTNKIRTVYGLDNSHIKACIVCANNTKEPRYILTEHMLLYNPKLKDAPSRTKAKTMKFRSGRLCRYLQRKLNIRVGTRTDFINHFSINQSLCADGQPCPHLPNC